MKVIQINLTRSVRFYTIGYGHLIKDNEKIFYK